MKLISLIIILFIIGCGKSEESFSSNNCTIQKFPTGVMISCSNEPTEFIPITEVISPSPSPIPKHNGKDKK